MSAPKGTRFVSRPFRLSSLQPAVGTAKHRHGQGNGIRQSYDVQIFRLEERSHSLDGCVLLSLTPVLGQGPRTVRANCSRATGE